MNSAPHLHTISLDTAAALTSLSKRTWQRRIEDGQVPRLADVRGRALLPFDAVRGLVDLPLDAADIANIEKADRGQALAQAEVGAMFALAALKFAKSAQTGNGTKPCGQNKLSIALHFLTLAAEQNEADAMHWLGLLYAAGLGEGDHRAQAVMWIANAATNNHAIACHQMQGLLARV